MVGAWGLWGSRPFTLDPWANWSMLANEKQKWFRCSRGLTLSLSGKSDMAGSVARRKPFAVMRKKTSAMRQSHRRALKRQIAIDHEACGNEPQHVRLLTHLVSLACHRSVRPEGGMPSREGLSSGVPSQRDSRPCSSQCSAGEVDIFSQCASPGNYQHTVFVFPFDLRLAKSEFESHTRRAR